VGRVITVAPFLFRAEGEMPTVLDPNEAAEARWIPLSLLRDPARHSLRPVPRLPQEMAFPAIELNGVPLWGFTYRVITEWLGLHAAQPSPQQAGFDAARMVLEFLLARGLTLARDWADRDGTMVAVVNGPIPVAAVRERFAFPGGQIPPVSLLEVRSECIRIAGWTREENLKLPAGFVSNVSLERQAGHQDPNAVTQRPIQREACQQGECGVGRQG